MLPPLLAGRSGDRLSDDQAAYANRCPFGNEFTWMVPAKGRRRFYGNWRTSFAATLTCARHD
jgi:hypothetical protein